jgi:hypothetical protein
MKISVTLDLPVNIRTQDRIGELFIAEVPLIDSAGTQSVGSAIYLIHAQVRLGESGESALKAAVKGLPYVYPDSVDSIKFRKVGSSDIDTSLI